MELSTLPCGPISANCYFLADEITHNCLIIDPGDADPVLELIRNKGYALKGVLLTHGHFDHCMGVAEILHRENCDVWMHEDDVELVDASSGYVSAMQYDLPPFSANHLLKGGEIISLDSIHLRVVHTPGHTKGGICFIDETNKNVFSGDTLFCESIGRTDLYGGSMCELARSVLDILFKLPDDYAVFPGHGEKTSIGYEKQHNPLVLYADYFRQNSL